MLAIETPEGLKEFGDRLKAVLLGSLPCWGLKRLRG